MIFLFSSNEYSLMQDTTGSEELKDSKFTKTTAVNALKVLVELCLNLITV